MEFSGFDDDLFVETEKRPNRAETVEYKPKTVLSQWYTEDQASPNDDIDKVHFYIYSGNQHYYQRAWSDALDAYTKALDYVAPNNGNFRRLLLESLARCRWRLGDADGAVEMGKKLLEESGNDHQLFCAHTALAMFYDAAGNTEDQARSLMLCLDLRPLSVQHWIQLAKIHLRKLSSKSCTSISNSSAVENNIPCKGGKGQINENKSLNSAESYSASHRTSLDDSAISSSSTKRSLAQNGNACSLTGQDGHKDISREYSVNKRSECILDKSKGGVDTSRVSHVGDDNSDECEKRLMEQSSSLISASVSSSTSSSISSPSSSVSSASLSVLSASSSVSTLVSSTASCGPSSVSLKQEDSPTPTGNVHTPCPPSAVPNGGDMELDKVAKLSLHCEGTPVTTASQVNGLMVDGGGDRDPGEGEGSAAMEAIKCLLRAQVILKSLQICAVSITKLRNDQLLAEIDELLSTLHLDAACIQEMSKKMYNEVYDKDIKQEIATS